MPDGSIAVGDIFNNRVLHYDTSGNLLGILFQTNGKSGANPYGLAVDPNDGTIYVGSAQCCGVQVYTTPSTVSLSYTYKTTIDPTGGPTSPTSRYPARLAVGSDGTVYVADMTLNLITAFSSQATGNTFLYRFGSYGTGPAQFKQPRGMAIGGGGTSGNPERLYVIDSGGYRVEVFDTSRSSNPTTHGYLYSLGASQGGQLLLRRQPARAGLRHRRTTSSMSSTWARTTPRSSGQPESTRGRQPACAVRVGPEHRQGRSQQRHPHDVLRAAGRLLGRWA